MEATAVRETAATLTGVAPEHGKRDRGRWVAVWKVETSTGRRFHHVPTPLLLASASRDEARAYALEHTNPMEEAPMA